jgi:hypothetical protein
MCIQYPYPANLFGCRCKIKICIFNHRVLIRSLHRRLGSNSIAKQTPNSSVLCSQYLSYQQEYTIYSTAIFRFYFKIIVKTSCYRMSCILVLTQILRAQLICYTIRVLFCISQSWKVLKFVRYYVNGV